MRISHAGMLAAQVGNRHLLPLWDRLHISHCQDAAQLAIFIQHRQAAGMRMEEILFREGNVVIDTQCLHRVVHRFFHKHRLEHIDLFGTRKEETFTCQPEGIHRARLNFLRDDQADRHRQQQRQNNAVITGHFKKQNGSRQRSMDSPSQYCSHSHQCIS